MEDVYVARQPIFDKNKNIYAYELLFRDGTANYVP
jgi:c-di-GMP-related signal transduction protein